MRLLPSIRTTIVTAVLAMSVACTPPDDTGTGGGAGGGVFSSGGGVGSSGGGSAVTGGGTTTTGGGDGSTGGGSAVTGGGDGTTGGGSAVTGGGDGTTGGGSAVTGGGDGTTGGGSAVTGGGDGTTGGGSAVTGGGDGTTGGGSAVTGGGVGTTGGGSAVTGGGVGTTGGGSAVTGGGVGTTGGGSAVTGGGVGTTGGGSAVTGGGVGTTGGGTGASGETCDSAIQILASGSFTGDTSTATDDVGHTTGCTVGYSSGTGPGNDVIYAVTVPDGYSLSATLTSSSDLSLWLLDQPATNCAATDSACITGSDSTSTETVVLQNTTGADRQLFVIVDSYSTTVSGAYTLDVEIVPPAVCGNGSTELGEECDDGNLDDGDGCDSNCTTTACGNGVMTGSEVCDDGNLDDGDGCDSNCTVTACGNGVISTPEVCDDGNINDTDGCSSTCEVEPTYVCTGTPSVCAQAPANDTCAGAEALVFTDNGDGTATATASGDTSFASNDNVPGAEVSCSSSADSDGQDLIYSLHLDSAQHVRVEVTATSTYQPVVYIREGTANCASDASEIACVAYVSGPVVVEPSGVLAAGDYFIWVDTYIEQPGAFSMSVTLTDPTTACGNGTVDAALGETCDDGPPADGDGCSSSCQVEAGWSCGGSPSSCVQVEQACGDGVDNDGDTFVDANDSDCYVPAYFPACAAGSQLYVYRSGAVNVTIPYYDAPYLSSIPVPALVGTVTRASLLLNISQLPNSDTWGEDLDILLTPPGGTELYVAGAYGVGAPVDFIDTVFDSTCAVAIGDATEADAPFSACYQPSDAFDSLAGSSPTGAWVLSVDDYYGSDGAQLDNWSLALCVGP